MKYQSIYAILTIALIAILGSCGDNPIDDHDDIKCDHIDADGMLVESGGVVVATQWEGAVVGQIALPESQNIPLDIVFLNQDSVRTLPAAECTDHSLRWEIGDTTVAQIIAVTGNRWQALLHGKVSGSTVVRFRVWHGDHVDFTSQIFTIVVGSGQPHSPLGTDAIALTRNCNDLASWNYNKSSGPDRAVGKIVVTLDQPLDQVHVRFLDTLKDQNGSRLTLEPNDVDFHLSWNVADESIVQIVPVSGEKWHVNMIGKLEGTTSVVFKLMFRNSEEFVSGAIPVIVRAPLGVDTSLTSFSITKGGVWKTVFRNGANLGFDTTCNRVLPAYLEVSDGELTDLFSFRLLDECSRIEPRSSQYSLGFDFADPCLARALAHPVHWGEYFVFHLEGLAIGETSMRIHFIRSDNHVEWTSPAIPVKINQI